MHTKLFKKSRYFRKLKVGILGKLRRFMNVFILVSFLGLWWNTDQNELGRKRVLQVCRSQFISQGRQAGTQGAGLQVPNWSRGGSKKIVWRWRWQRTDWQHSVRGRGLGESRPCLSFQNAWKNLKGPQEPSISSPASSHMMKLHFPTGLAVSKSHELNTAQHSLS